MNALSNLRIGTRLAIAFTIVLVLSTISTWFAVDTARDNANATSAMMKEPQTRARAAADWYTQTSVTIARTVMLAQTSDQTLATTFAEIITEGSKKGSALNKRVGDMLTTPEEKELYKQTLAARDQFVKAKQQLIDANKAGDMATAARVLKEFTPAADAYLAGVESLVKYERKMLDDMAADIEASTARRMRLSILLGVLLVGLGGACSFLITRSITGPLGKAVDVASTVASGDLTTEFAPPTQDEVGDLMRALRGMNDSLSKVVGEVQQGTVAISQASGEIAAGNHDLSKRTEQQASSLEETASSLEELTATVKQNADNARQANQLAQNASGVAERGGAIVSQVVDTMGAIDTSAKKIVDIIAVIDGIAFQTNILALNAAVEAARAGEQGRGFAVVATEVRNLAQRSASAAKEIKALIDDSVQQVGLGATLVEQAGGTMDEVVAAVRRVTDMMGEITAASVEQSAGIDQLNQAVGEMDQVTQQNAALVEQAAAAAASMEQQAARLAEAAAGFRLTSGPAHGRMLMSSAAAPVRESVLSLQCNT